jgi:hypothetical protein
LAVRAYAAIPIVIIRTATSVTAAIGLSKTLSFVQSYSPRQVQSFGSANVVSARQAFRRHVNRNRGRIGPGSGYAGPSALVDHAQIVDV